MNDDIIIVDDIIPVVEQEAIKNHMLSRLFPWFYTPNITNANSNLFIPAFSHVFKEMGLENSSMYTKLEHIGKIGAAKYDLSFDDVYHVRSFLQTPRNVSNVNLLHTDIAQEHVVVLYYVLDSDGDTVIVDKKFTGIEEDLNIEDCNIIHSITPKQGRAIIFNGNQYHASSTPTNGVRCVINFDVIQRIPQSLLSY